MNDVDAVPRVPDLQVVIRPNRSLTAWGMAATVGTAAALSLAVAAAAMAMGAWPVLPFAGLEILLLACAFVAVARHRDDFELLTVAGNVITVRRRIGRREQSWVFQRYWARVSVREPPRFGWPSQLGIRSHGREVGIGTWLTEDARAELAQRLGRVLGRTVAQADGDHPDTGT